MKSNTPDSAPISAEIGSTMPQEREERPSAATALPRGPRYDSQRYTDAHGEPMPAYVVGEYVIEKARRDWDHRVAGQSAAMWAGPREWWEVRRQGHRTLPGVSIGDCLYQGNTLMECIAWIGRQA